jgi:uncharacterized protein involved in exopolysaccharide biosynthesis
MTPALDESPLSPIGRDPEGTPLLTAVDAVRRHHRLVAGLALGSCVLVAAITLFQPRTYTSFTTFMPHASQNKLSQLSGLASQFGFTVPANDPGATPAFYAFLLQSRELLGSAVNTTFDVQAKGRGTRATLTDWYNPPGDTPAQREEAAIERLRRDLRAGTDGETGTVELKVRTPSARLSFEVAQRLMQLVGEFNLEKRQSQAAAERKFVQSQLEEAKARLHDAEDLLQGFLQRNREYRSSPQLTFEYDRLARDVSMRQQVYNSLAQSFEQARIDEVRNTPVFTLIDPPNLPAKPDRRWLLAKALLGVLLGGLIGVFVALAREFVAGGPGPDQSTEEDRSHDRSGLAVAPSGELRRFRS